MELERLVRRGGPANERAKAKVAAAEAQLLKARLLYVPRARFELVYSIVPEYRCTLPEAFRDVSLSGGGNLYDAMNTRAVRERFCMGTDNSDTAKDYFRNFDPRNYYFRFELNLGQPLYTFGKIRHAKSLARHGVAAARLAETQTLDEAVHGVRRAYFGLKLAREMLFTIEEGEEQLRKAEKRMERALAKEDGETDRTDQYRLQIARADVDELTQKVKRGESMALAGLRALLGSSAPKGLDIDDRPLDRVKTELKPLDHYLALARKHRPEIKLLKVALQAAQTTVKLRKASFLPDLMLLMRYRLNLSTSKDDPRNAYLRDELHGNSVYIGLALKWDLDFHFKYADLAKAQAELVATRHMGEQARLGLELQVERAHGQLADALRSLEVLGRARAAARRWLVTMGQRHEMGTASTKPLIDALKARFQADLRYLEAVNSFNMAAVDLSRLVGVEVASLWETK
ncbi:MAG: TolC family protein [Polyangia bacterium]|nr:TolC family protein [Polyangia bacterium]